MAKAPTPTPAEDDDNFQDLIDVSRVMDAKCISARKVTEILRATRDHGVTGTALADLRRSMDEAIGKALPMKGTARAAFFDAWAVILHAILFAAPGKGDKISICIFGDGRMMGGLGSAARFTTTIIGIRVVWPCDGER